MLFFVFVVVALVVGGALAYYGWYNSEAQRTRRALKAAERVPIGMITDGTEAKIVGEVQAERETIAAPLTGRPCVYYDITVDQQVQSGKSSHWKRIIRERRGVRFRVDDDSGRAVVDPAVCHIVLEMDAQTRSGTWDDATQVEEAFLARHKIESKGWLFNKTLRYSEGVLEVGERVAVLGRGMREPDRDAQSRVSGYRSALPTRLVMSGSEQAPLRISDDPKLTGEGR